MALTYIFLDQFFDELVVIRDLPPGTVGMANDEGQSNCGQCNALHDEMKVNAE